MVVERSEHQESTRVRFAAICLLLILALSLPLEPSMAHGPSKGNPRSSASEAESLRRFFADDWRYWMEQYPEFATNFGYSRQNRRWTDYSPAAIERRNHHLYQSLQALDRIDRVNLPAPERLNFDLYRKLLTTAIGGLRFHNEPFPFAAAFIHSLDLPLNQREGVLQDVENAIAQMPAEHLSDYEDIVARLDSVPALVDQTIALLQQAIERGVVPPRITISGVPKQLEDQLFADAMASPLLSAFRHISNQVPAAKQEPLRKAASASYLEKVVPSFRKLHDFLISTYLPRCRLTIAVSASPGGTERYAYDVSWHTTTPLTPQEIHEMGLQEVHRIHGEMEKEIAALGFKGTFAEFTYFLRTDPQFFFTDPQGPVVAYRDIAMRAEPQLTSMFGKLPRLRYGVEPVPDSLAPSRITAYYEPGVPGSRPAYFMVNTYSLKDRPKWQMEAVALHEAVPGHHLQTALAQELDDVPEFRKNLAFTAYTEGWGLYAEHLGAEMGFYTDGYQRFGHLNLEMWRAARLVVDTGIHSMGWTRDQAIEYCRDHTGLTDGEIEIEVDRYIAWPGQGLAYKIGELKIKQLRTDAERELGTAFSRQRFHDAVLD
jgi:uncharacterized protein (DUF885 family)